MQLNSYRYFGSPPSAEALTDETLDAVFSALADSTRRKILARLAEGEASVAELAEPFQLTQPAISKHLKVLENAGLVSHARDAQRRPRKLEAARLEEATGWLENYRRFWEGRYRRLDTVLADLVHRETVKARPQKRAPRDNRRKGEQP